MIFFYPKFNNVVSISFLKLILVFFILAIFLFFGGLVPRYETEVQNNLHISNNGYTYEENLLYFPLYPLMIKGMAESISWMFRDLVYMEGLSFEANPSLLLLSSILINAIFFIFATDRLYYLSRKVLK